MGRFKRLGKNTTLIFLGTSGSKLITFLMLPLYTRWLNVDQYGAVDLVTTYSTLFLGIISLSIFDSIFIFPKDQSKIKQSQYFSSCILFWVVTSLLTVLICICVSNLSSVFGWHGFFIDYLWQIFVLLIISYFQQLIQQFCRSIDKMNVYAFTGLIQTIGMVAVSFYIIPKYKVNGYIGALIVGNIAGIIYSLFYGGVYKYFSLKSYNKEALIEMLKYSIPIIPNGIMWFLVNSINRPLLEEYHGLTAVGLIAIANKIPTLINQIYMIFQNAFTISAIEESRSVSYQTFYNQTLKMVLVGQILLVSAVAICCKWVLQHFTSPEYYSAWKYIPILAYGVLFTNIATFVGTNFTINRKSKYFFYATVWAALSALTLNFLLIPKLAIWGACIALIVSQVIGMAARIKYSWEVVQIKNWGFYFWNLFLTVLVVTLQTICLPFVVKTIILLIIGITFYFINRTYIHKVFQLVCNMLHKKN